MLLMKQGSTGWPLQSPRMETNLFETKLWTICQTICQQITNSVLLWIKYLFCVWIIYIQLNAFINSPLCVAPFIQWII